MLAHGAGTLQAFPPQSFREITGRQADHGDARARQSSPSSAGDRSRRRTGAASQILPARIFYCYRRVRSGIFWPPHAAPPRHLLRGRNPTGRLAMNVQTRMNDIQGLTKIAPVSRRLFVTASAATAAGYTLAAGPVRADAIKTDTAGLTVGEAKVKVAGGDMPVYFAKPANVANPPVILVAMEIFGLHEYIRDVTRRLAKLGAFAVAPDYYFRAGVDLTKIDDLQKLFPIVNAKPDKELFADLDATVDWAKSQGGDTNRLGVMGFCRGGRTVWLYSTHNPNLKAGVAFYGSLADPENDVWPKNALSLAAEVKEPVLGLYGAEDA